TDNGATLEHPKLGTFWCYAQAEGAQTQWLFCENNTNNQVVFGTPNDTEFVKDGINDAIVGGRTDRVSREVGSKAAAVATATIPAGESWTVTVRFCPTDMAEPFADADDI
ncbi:hypothetical protein RZS08_38350, partial [Arthrospira platensis SPKY1]|nr:hypothetical protein [Arthrospira platensis SPKY1]